MGNLSSGCGCANERMSCGNNNTDCCSIIWILLLLSVFCGGKSGMNLFGGNCGSGCGCDDGCGSNSCIWIILLLLFCGNGSCGLFGGSNNGGCGCGCGCASAWNNGCSDSCGC